ncbi:hypothetical protein BDC45DRAFT_534058 [Circinella umbellata]|nr:hypothetical protein BDC45DRAFT_534058 [Circinella umbellata]
MLIQYLAVLIVSFLTTIPLTARAWGVSYECFLCDSTFSLRADDMVYFIFSDVPKNISAFDIYLAFDSSTSSLEIWGIIGRNVDPPFYYGFMPSDVVTSSQYYFVIESTGSYKSRSIIGPLDVLSKNAIDPYATTTTTTTTTTYGYGHTTTSGTYRSTPTGPSYDEWEEYQSRLHALYIGKIVGSVVGSVLGLAIIICGFFYMRRRNKRELAAQQEHQRELAPPQPIIMGHDETTSTAPSGTPPMTPMVVMPVPPHEQPHEPPQPGYYYAMLAPPQQPSAAHITVIDSNPHLSMPVPPQHGSYSPDSSNISTQPLHQQQNNNSHS